MTSSKLVGAVGVCATLWLAACSNDATAPRPEMAVTAAAPSPALIADIRRLAAARRVTRLQRPAPIRPALVELGQALAFDKILSGNRDISCMTCHFPTLGTGDNRSLAIGQGATGLGVARRHPQNRFIPRNTPPLYNLHVVKKFTWDGRIFRDAQGIVRTPVGRLPAAMEQTVEFGALSVQPMFPVLSRPEMRGNSGNELATLADNRHLDIWRALMTRLGNIPEYRTMFERAYPGQRFQNMTFAHASNAIGGFIADRLAFADTPWDRFLAGDNGAMSEAQLRGAGNFLRGRCVFCHTGAGLSDGNFHNVALAQVGPGLGDGVGGRDDFGRMRVTKNPAHRYAFRTTPLRNVELTAPYGHDGAIVDLRSFVDHYSQSDVKLSNYDPSQLEPALRGTLLPTAADILATRDTLLAVIVLPPAVVDDITEFLKSLTDPAARDLNHLVPARVPSGLPVDRLP